ncbi:MAG: glycosyltransferase [Candidatus Marinimicrobia bacterium]|nr:glycosyltransferase [Candidatus Neomarinimicrobiota bacterium]MBL7023163.1 glycosyltransferase [Candidatus Neomarinimicrobiota bacterium]MBL7109029.1 glycosyltransferase [Candidatus Neomarinimicrobiota bacterium]
MIFVKIILWGVSLYYLGTLIWFITGLKKYKLPVFDFKNPLSVSVIVAVRNGEISLQNLFSDLEYQDYPGQVEFIFVDDESTDDTALLIQNQSKKDSRFRFSSSKVGSSLLSHKKKALDAGISTSTGEVILFTDVDCKVKSGWVSAMVSYFQNGADYVIGYSETLTDSSMVSSFQSTDFLMLMLASLGSTNNGNAWASTGQNQGFTRKLFDEVGGYDSICECLQGDDSLFLQVCRNIKKPRVAFSLLSDSFVVGRTENCWNSFIKQRMRWAGDARLMWKYNPVFFLSILSTFSYNLLLILFLLLSVKAPYFFGVFFILFSLKFVLEYILFRNGSTIFIQRAGIHKFVLWFLIQIPYIIYMGIGSFWSSQLSWRGRKRSFK